MTQKQEFALFNARVVADKKEQTKKVKKKFFSVADVIAESEGIHPNQSYLDIDESGEMIVKQRM